MVENPFNRKAIFIHKTANVKGGDPVSTAQMLADAGFEAVYVKAGEGVWAYTPDGVPNLTATLVAELKKREIAVIGWGFCYGNDPAGEGNIGASQVNRFGLDGWIFDVESKFEAQANAADKVGILFDTFHRNATVPSAFCSWFFWRSPTTGALWHNEAMAKVAMTKADFGMPMIYWQGSTVGTATWYLKESLRQWGNVTSKPIIPVGRAYDGDGGTALPETVSAFAAEVHALTLPGLSWWFMDQAHLRPDIWSRLAAIPPFGSVSPPNVDYQGQINTLTGRVAALKTQLDTEVFSRLADQARISELEADMGTVFDLLVRVRSALG